MKWPGGRGGARLDEHATDEQLILLNDGELPEREAAQIKQHLNSCWHCRGRAAGFEQVIASFSEERSTTHADAVQRFTTTWPALRFRLRQSVKQAAGRRATSRPQWLAWAVAALLVLALGLGLWPPLSNPRTVSAAELVGRSLQAEDARLARAIRPVVHVRMEMRLPGRQRPADLELWHDRTGGRMRRAGDREALQRLERVMAANGMGGRRPLSMDAYSAWRSAARAVDSSVSDTTLAGGETAYELKTRAEGSTPVGGVAAITTVIRKSDFHPVRQTLLVEEPSGRGEYDLTETRFDLLTGNLVPPGLFDDPPAPTVEAATGPRGAAAVGGEAASSNETVTARSSLPEVLYALHRAHACNEQIQVERDDAGRLTVKGIVESVARRQELLAALGQLPDARVEIETPEADLARVPRPADGAEPTTRLDLSPLDVLLRASGPGASLRVSAQSVRGVSACMREVWALRRLAQGVSASDETRLTPASRWLLEQMVRDHASALGRRSLELRAVLEALGAGPDNAEAAPDKGSFASWREQTGSLLAAFESADNAVRILVSPAAQPVADAAPYAAEARSAIGAAVRTSDAFTQSTAASTTPRGDRQEEH